MVASNVVKISQKIAIQLAKMSQNQLGKWLRHFREEAGLTQKQLAEQTNYNGSTISRVEKGHRQPTKEYLDVFITTLASFLTEKQQQEMIQRLRPPDHITPLTQTKPVQIDWGNMLEVPVVFGRQDEQNTIKQWLLGTNCRFVSVLGIGGIGKTALAMHVAKDLASKFDYVVWRSLRYAPPLDDLLRDLLHFFYFPDEIQTTQDLNSRLLPLIQFFRANRCLLILDNLESVLDSHQAGHYRTGYEAYDPFINQLSQSDHQSSIIMTSREIPRTLSFLEGGKNATVRTLHLSGLSVTAGTGLLKNKGLVGSNSDWAALIDHYSGNPLALTIVAEMIREVYGGEIEDFLIDGYPIFGGIYDVITEQFSRLSQLEQSILCWLAIEREPVSLEALADNLVPLSTKGHINLIRRRDIAIALRSLRRRSLIEANEKQFFLQYVIAEFVTNHLVETITHEIENRTLSFFLSHALLKAQAKEYIREGQVRLFLQPILQQLLSKMRSPERVGELLLQNFDEIRGYLSAHRLPNYAASNTIHLLYQLNYPLTNLDFSKSAIWQADLRRCLLHNVNLSQADLRYTAFAEEFSSILAVGISPDGKLYAAGTENGEVRLWSVINNRPYHVFDGHVGWVRSVAFSPNGRFLISGGDDQTIRVWDTRTKRAMATLKAHNGRILSLAFSPDSTRFASGSSDGSIKLWQAETQQQIGQLQGHTSAVWSITFSANGTLLASGSDDAHAYIWQISNKKRILDLHLPQHKIRSIAFVADQQIVATGSEDQTVILWDLHTKQPIHILRGHEGRIKSIAISPNGHLLASGSEDRTIRLWNCQTGQCLRVLQPEGDADRIVSVAFEGQRLISGSQDRFVRIWDVETGQCLHAFHGYHNWVRAVAFSQNGHFVASGNQNQTVIVWHAQTNEVIHRLRGHTNWVWTVAFSPDDQLIASGSQDKTIKLWNVEHGTCSQTLYGHRGRVTSVAFHPNGRFLVSGGIDKLVKLWDLTNNSCISTFLGHDERIRSVAFSPDGTMIASGSEDHTVKIWGTENGRLLASYKEHINRVTSVAFHPHDALLASSSYDHTVKIWDIHTHQCQQTLSNHTDLVMSIAFSPDGRRLASCSLDKTVRLWDVPSGRCLWTGNNHTSWVRAIVFSPDGNMLVSAGDDETIRFWDTQSGKNLKTLWTARPYEGLNITGIRGVTEVQRDALIALGAVDSSQQTLSPHNS